MQSGLNFKGISGMSANKSVLSKPLIIGDVVYMGVCDKYFYALSLDKGDVIWSYYADGPIMTTAIMHDDVLYFGAEKSIYAIAKDGQFLWKFITGGIVLGTPTIHNDTIFFGSGDNYFYAVSLKTKEVIFKIRTGAEIISDIFVEKNKIYFGSQDYCIYCVDLNGTILWKYRSKGAVMTGSVAVTKDKVFFASADENLYALSKKDGTFLWGFKTGDQVFNNPYILGSNVCIGSRDRHFYMLEQETGRLVWKFRGNDEIDWVPCIYDGMIIISSDKLYALDMNGNVLWSYPMPPFYISCDISASNGIVVFGAADGYIRGILAKDGTLIWKFKTRSDEMPRFGDFMAPPKWDPDLFNKFEKLDNLERLNEVESFNPYTFNRQDIETQNKKKYIAGEDVLNLYELASNPVSYAEKSSVEAKKRRKELEGSFFGASNNDAKRYG